MCQIQKTLKNLGLLAYALLIILACATSTSALAEEKETLRYPYTQVWSATTRLVRVDLNYTITESNQEAGYLLFEYDNRGKPVSGSFEFIDDGAGKTLNVLHKVPAMPAYVERLNLDRLIRKLKNDYGEEPSVPRKETKKSAPGKTKSSSPSESGPKQD